MKNSIKTAAKTMAAVIAAGAMAVAPVAGTINLGAVTAMADMADTATKKQPMYADAGTVTINGLATGDTVKLYRIVERKWKDATNHTNYDGWQITTKASGAVTDNSSNANATWPFTANISGLMTKVTATGDSAWTAEYSKTLTAEDNSSYTNSNVQPGEYLVVVTPGDSNAYIYNPMLISSYYKEAENGGFTLENGVVSSTGSMTQDAGGVVYAKKSEVTLEKKITNPDSKSGANDANAKTSDGDDLQVGDTQEFTITTKIPDYRGYANLDHDSLKFVISDNQDKGLTLNKNSIKVYADVIIDTTTTATTELPATDSSTNKTNWTITYGNFTNDYSTDKGDEKADDNYAGDTAFTANAEGHDFIISFDKDYLLSTGARAVKVVYKSTLNENATQKTVANDNIVRLKYTNKNATSNQFKTLGDHTYDYSFPIDIKKVNAADVTDDATAKSATALKAQFSITRMAKSGNTLVADSTVDSTKTNHTATTPVSVWTTNDGTETGAAGQYTIKHLDEGYYKFTETQAPDGGYSLNTEDFYIFIDPTYNNDGTLQTYTISQVDKDGNTLAQGATTSAHFVATETTDADAGDWALIVSDTKVSGLPSTGARSALILTVAGIAVMITVMAASRKKKIAD